MVMRWHRLARFAFPIFLPVLSVQAQTNPRTPPPGPSCPVEFVHFNPWGVNVRIKNVSGKKIVGLIFNAALADATEHWKWFHWDFDTNRSLRDFSWNKSIKPGDAKTLSWDRADLDFEHGGGGAFVLTSVLFDDGTDWEAPPDSAPCKFLWFNNHKKFFVKPVALPFRQ
jgi:hypothetical protein